MARKKRLRNEMWSVEGDPWRYRKPFVARGKWRVRRRHKVTGTVEMITLDSGKETTAKREVIEKAAEERAAAEARAQNLEIEPRNATIAAALDEWSKTLDVRPTTREEYDYSIALYKRALGPGRLIGEVQLIDLEALFFTFKSTDGKWKEGSLDPSGEGWANRSGRTKIKHREMLSRFWKWAIDHGYARANLPDKVNVPKLWRKEVRLATQTKGQALSLDEARTLLDACRGKRIVTYAREHYGRDETVEAEIESPDYLWWFTFISLRAGLRKANVLGDGSRPPLCWGDVDLDEEKVIRLPPESMKNGLPFVAPLHEELVSELRKLRASLEHIPAKTDPIIPGTAGSEIRKAFMSALKRAGLGDRGFRIHDLRHTYISMLGAYCTHAVMQRLAGHAAASVTDRYAKHQDLDVLRKGVNSLPCLLGVDNITPVVYKSS
jgi:integrase